MSARTLVAGSIVAFLAACGPGTLSPDPGSGGSPSDGGATGTPDAGTGGGATGGDAGQGAGSDAAPPGGGGQQDGGSGGSGGGSPGGGGGQDGGAVSSDCDGLTPGAPAAPIEFRWPDRDLSFSDPGRCDPAETDGTGHVALRWQHERQPGDTAFAFLDPQTGSQVGSYSGAELVLIGQASGFIGGNCAGAMCSQNYVVVDPIGKQLFASSFHANGTNVQANDPTGGMIQARLSGPSTSTTKVLLDAIAADGTLRWTQSLPDEFGPSPATFFRIGVDRRGNVLAIWSTKQGFGPGTWSGQWFDHSGTPSPVFQALSGGVVPDRFYERVDDGLFLSGGNPGAAPGWLGQFDAQATSMSAPPAWLAARPGKALHMVHGGKGYAVLPASESSAACEQQVEVVSPSGQVCGSATFSMGGGACTTKSIVVGYDGTVVQQGPRERETCTAAGHICTCTYRFWPGFFR